MYLESSSPANTAYYAKFGFEFKKDIFLRDSSGAAVTMSIMVREPRPPRAKAYMTSVKVNLQTTVVHQELVDV